MSLSNCSGCDKHVYECICGAADTIILVPAHRFIEPETEASLRKLEQRGFRVDRRFGMSAIDQARAIMATDAILAGYQWLFWVDSDIMFEPADFEKIWRWDEKFCCAPYAMKQSGGMIAATGSLPPNPDGKQIITAAGFGFMKTHREIYEAMIPELPTCRAPGGGPLIPFFQPRWWGDGSVGGAIYYGEDYSFCLHAKKLGFELKADFSVEIGHIGRWAFQVRNPL